jgi:putative AlgH/UPF0301 family transcriptional regulator
MGIYIMSDNDNNKEPETKQIGLAHIAEATILVAAPELRDDPDLGNSVLLVLEDGEGGSVAINLAGPRLMGSAIQDGGPMEGDGAVLFVRPAQDGGFDFHGFAFTEENARVVGILESALSNPEEAKKYGPAGLFMNYVGWSAGQLAQEREAGFWKASPITVAQILETPIEQRYAAATAVISAEQAPAAAPRASRKPAP